MQLLFYLVYYYYSWRWTRTAPETCRVIINQVKQELHLVGYLLIQYYKDARYHEHKIHGRNSFLPLHVTCWKDNCCSQLCSDTFWLKCVCVKLLYEAWQQKEVPWVDTLHIFFELLRFALVVHVPMVLASHLAVPFIIMLTVITFTNSKFFQMIDKPEMARGEYNSRQRTEMPVCRHHFHQQSHCAVLWKLSIISLFCVFVTFEKHCPHELARRLGTCVSMWGPS